MSRGSFLKRNDTAAIPIQKINPCTRKAVRQLKLEMRYVAKGAIKTVPTPAPEEVMPTTKPRFLTNHLEAVEFATT